MADDVNQQIENTLNTIVNLMEKSGNLKKELKNYIHETVSTLRKLIFTLKSNFLEKTEESNTTQNEVKQLKDTLENLKSTTSARLAAPSLNSFTGLTSHKTTASPTPSGGRKLFSEALSGKNAERHRLTVKPTDSKSAEEIKKLIRRKIDPVNMKIGIRAFKSLKNGNVLIEADRKEEIEMLNTQIRDKCGGQLETNV
jgi:vacuolar-type H+-ATPase subunit I/STV1